MRTGGWAARRMGAALLAAAVAAVLVLIVTGAGPGFVQRAAADVPTPPTQPQPPPPPGCPDTSTTISDAPTSVPCAADQQTTTTTTAPPPPSSTTTTSRPATTTTAPPRSPNTTAPPSGGTGPGAGPGPGPNAPAPGGPAAPSPGAAPPSPPPAVFLAPPGPAGSVFPAVLTAPPGLLGPPSLLDPLAAPLDAPPAAALGGGDRSTGDLMDLVQQLHLAQAAVNRLVAPLPIAGRGTWPPAASPAGVDIGAVGGIPVVAPGDGTVHLDPGAGPGERTATVTGRDNTLYTYGSLDQFSASLVDGQIVSRGDLLGTVGAAPGTPPHLHFELRPTGGAPSDPVPYLDRWLTRAMQTVQGLLGAGKRAGPSPFNGEYHLPTQNASFASPATILPGLGLCGFAVWFAATRFLRRRRGDPDPDERPLPALSAALLIRPPRVAAAATARWDQWWERVGGPRMATAASGRWQEWSGRLRQLGQRRGD